MMNSKPEKGAQGTASSEKPIPHNVVVVNCRDRHCRRLLIGLKSESWYKNLPPTDRAKYPPIVAGYIGGFAYCRDCIGNQE